MVVEWSVECSADDPVLVVPWTLAEAGAAASHAAADFVDLRENPYDLDQIPEAEQNPPLMQALRALNAGRSPVFTAKCDAWAADGEELEQMRLQLDQSDENRDAACGFASYIDLVWRDRVIFASFHQSEQLLHRLERLALPIDEPLALLDCVLRPALIDLTGPQEGFAVSLYVKALGPDLAGAKQVWGSALEAVVALLRSNDIAMA
jgi:hypothetical protein